MNKKEIEKLAKIMEMPKIDNQFCANMLKSIIDFRLKDGSLPFATPDYMYLEDCIKYLEGKKQICSIYGKQKRYINL